MQLLMNPASMPRCVLVLGMFDGVHRGHQALLMAGLDMAEARSLPLVVSTFEPHPLRVLRPDAMPPLLTTLTERARLMASFGVDALCVTTFDRRRAAQEPQDFLEEMLRVYRPRVVVCGYNFSFGRFGAGNGETIRAFGESHGFDTVIIPEVVCGGTAVSSTRIRSLLQQGDAREATRLLGHPYTLSGKVAGGKQIGRTMGFPTANVQAHPHKLLPAFGVYACWMETPQGVYPAVVNVGRHPTLPEGGVTVEAYALDECLSLYGKKVRLLFLDFLRPKEQS